MLSVARSGSVAQAYAAVIGGPVQIHTARSAMLSSNKKVGESAHTAEQEAPRAIVNRRTFIKGGVAGAASISFGALLARRAGAAQLPYTDDYGPVALVNDLT